MRIRQLARFMPFFFIGCVVAASTADAQTPAAGAQFEVASVKQMDKSLPPGQPDLSFLGTGGKPFQITGTRVAIRGTLRALILTAWNVWPYQLTDEPAWADSVVWEITAKAEGDKVPTQDEVRLMLRALLEDRFQVKLRRETKELPVYHLVAGKKNIGLKQAGPDETFQWRLSPADGGMLRSKATKEPIGDFIKLVGVSADRPVIDKLGMTGDIDYDIIIYTQEARSQDDVNRAILDAVKDQLGLKLEPAKDAIERLVVESAAKASDN